MVTAFEASTVPTLQLPVCRAAAQHGASRSSTQCHRAAIEALAGLTSHLEAPGGKSASELIFVGRMVPISLLAVSWEPLPFPAIWEGYAAAPTIQPGMMAH